MNKITYHKGFIIGNNDRMRIPEQARRILFLVMSKKIATHEEIMETVWPDCDVQPDSYWEIIKIHISKLNKFLDKNESYYRIVSVWGRGYSLETVN